MQHTVVVAAITETDDGVSYTEICRFTDMDDKNAHMARYKNEDALSSIHRMAWSVNEQGEPLICVIGMSRMVKVYNVTLRKLERVLISCGASLHDIRVPKQFPFLVFTAGEDREVRIWNLRNKTRPLAAIFAGSGDVGHIKALVSVHFSFRTGPKLRRISTVR
jgi:WD40 repeat protein